MTNIAVIGAGYGDCSKGNAVSFFTRELAKGGQPPLVTRGNGGAQAGHTVVDGERRHVFGHVSAGTFAGAPTYLASGFIINPPVLNKELLKLKAFNVRPNIYASPLCRVTTLYDMALNALAELTRGNDRHGSCGLGINETVLRHDAGYPLTLETLKSKSSGEVAATLKRIREEWVPRRLEQLEKNSAPSSGAIRQRTGVYLSSLDADRLDLANTLRRFAGMISIADSEVLNDAASAGVIFEGAQGLLLDMHLGKFPYVTHSITGLPSAVKAVHECGKRDWPDCVIYPVYVTRPYVTRHGAGPLAHEGVEVTNCRLIDTTNVPNEWQGELRYAPLDIPLLRDTIARDWQRGELEGTAHGIQIKRPRVFLSCLDQLGDWVRVHDGDGFKTIDTCDFAQYLEDAVDLPIGFISSGPTANDVDAIRPI